MPNKSVILLCSILGTLNGSPLHAQDGRIVRYDMKMQDLKTVYGVLPPVMHVQAGDIIDTTTVDADGKDALKAGFNITPNPLTGPFYIDGAEPGDTLAVKFVAIDVNSPFGWGDAGPGFGALNSSIYTPMLGTPIPVHLWTYSVDPASNTADFHAKDSDFSVKIPVHAFLGCVGVAPAHGEARSSIVPAEFGGNLDASEASVGNTLYLPVNVAGALLSFGDGHAAMGDGEIDGSGIEISMKVRLQVNLIKHQRIDWPRFENDDYIMAVGVYRPVDDALRIAFTELIHWMHQSYGLSEMDSYELLSKVAEIHLAEMVDPNYVVVAKIRKQFLPLPVSHR
jgi:acetamidase/formamidase